MSSLLPDNKVARLIVKGFLILMFIIAADRLTGMTLRHFFFSQNEGEQSHFTSVIDSTNSEILIFGSSRACHSYIPEIIENRLHYTCYNAGRDGNFVLYNYALFKSITKRYSPRIIFFDIRPYDIEYMPYEYDRLSVLLPYYDSHPEIRDIINLRGPFEKLKHVSSVYPYNSLALQILRGNLSVSKSGEPDYKGYIPLHKVLDNQELKSWNIIDCNADPNKLSALKDMISLCREKNIRLIFVYSPIWVRMEDSKCNNIIPSLCAAEGIEYIDISNDPAFMKNPQYFEDLTHVNDEGAKIFTNMLINRL